MRHSILFRLAAIPVALLGIAFLLLWTINNTFLERFYYQNKVDQIIECYKTIQYCANTDSLTEDEIGSAIQQIRDKYNLAIVYADLSWSVNRVFASPEEEQMLVKTLQFFVMNPNGNFNAKQIYNSSNMQIYEMEESQSQTSYLYCWGSANNSSIFIMRTPLESISESTRIANRFLLYTGSVIALLSVMLSLLATRTMTKPIRQLALLSEKMAHLDFKERYQGHGKDEIGTLGLSMNAMADQLERSIEELKTANAQLKEEIEKKVQIDEMRKEFLSNVSHELKTPIALIQGYAEGLQEVVNDDPESRDYYCDVIVDEAEKMNVMVRKLLTLNHLEFGQDVIEMGEFDLSDLIDSVVHAANIMIQQKGIRVSVKIPDICIVKGDEFKIEEVLTNYLSNALNHADKEKIMEIVLTKREGADGKKRVRVSVRNTGECIPEEDLEKVWIKFYKVDKARTREYGGSGIGLSIVKAIMDSHHQDYGVFNWENGVEFWFELEQCENQDAREGIR